MRSLHAGLCLGASYGERRSSALQPTRNSCRQQHECREAIGVDITRFAPRQDDMAALHTHTASQSQSNVSRLASRICTHNLVRIFSPRRPLDLAWKQGPGYQLSSALSIGQQELIEAYKVSQERSRSPTASPFKPD
jgi:hypothetical protein